MKTSFNIYKKEKSQGKVGEYTKFVGLIPGWSG